MTIAIAIAAIFLLIVLAVSIYLKNNKSTSAISLTPPNDARPTNTDPKIQLLTIKSPSISVERRKIMNKNEATVFYELLNLINTRTELKGWHAFPQVSLGEIMHVHGPDTNLAKAAYGTINAKRSDIVFCDNLGWPRAVIEYQGSGHYLGSGMERDRVKEAACQRAGIAFIEIHDDDEIKSTLHRKIALAGLILSTPNDIHP